jgi:mannose-6-phosphate isomerase-like protein (cupin superfamily)
MHAYVIDRDPAGERSVAPDPANERVAYVQSGALIVTIADDPPVELHGGDSYVVPAGTGHRFEVLEPATVVEAVGPAGASGLNSCISAERRG